jgi:DNA-binding transcriptional MerR regulator
MSTKITSALTAVPAHVLDGHISRKEFAKEMGVTERTVTRWNDQGIGPPEIVIHKRHMYSRASIAAWLASKEIRRAS